jgi:hypothetical protein
MFVCLFRTVQIVALFAGTGLSVGLEQLFQLVEAVGLRSEVAHMLICYLDSHLGAVITVVAVPLDNGGFDTITEEDMLEGAFDGSGAGTRGSRYGNDWMFF